jgi:iron(III) transport system ATP-binding protein
MELINVDKISKKFGANMVLTDISFSLKKGEFGCLLGSSGSGKSTLLRIIAGLEVPDQGSIVLEGNILSGENVFVKPEKRSIGMIFQDYALFPHLTIEQNIYFGISNDEKKNEPVQKLIAVLGLSELLQRYPHQISGGQQQRVAIARTLAVNPKIVLMDEPFSNLDEWMKEEVRDELKQILRDLGATVLFVTHHATDALSFADKIMVMDEGKIIQAGTAVSIIDSPVNSKIAGIFGKVNVFSSDELKALFGIQKDQGNYFIRPEHFQIGTGGEWLVTECVYHGNYYDTNLKQDGRSIHVHLNKAVDKNTSIGLKPFEKNIHLEQV